MLKNIRKARDKSNRSTALNHDLLLFLCAVLGKSCRHRERVLYPRRHSDSTISSFRALQLAIACSNPPTRPKVFGTPSPVQALMSQSPVYAVPGPLHLVLALVGSLFPPLQWLTNPAWDLAHHSSFLFAIRGRLVRMLVCLPGACP